MIVWKIVSVVAVVFAVIALITAALVSREVSVTRSQLAAARAQIATDRRGLAAVAASASGTHRDLITCADLENMLNGYTGPNAGGYIGLNQYLTANGAGYTIPLPDHCLNR